MGINKRNNIRFLIVIAALFLLFELSQLMLPAFHEEEALDASIASDIAEKLSFILSAPSIKNLISHFKYFPIMLTAYHGALQSYFIMPFYLFLGHSAFSMRIYAVFTGLAVIFAMYFVVKEFFDKKIAQLAVILLTLNFVFLEHIKFGIVYGSIMQFIMLLSLLFFLLWYRRKNYLYFYFSFFLLGAGLSIRAYFIWPILGLFLGSLIFRNKLRQRFFLERNNFRKLYPHFIVAVIFFGLGSFLLIAYNLSTNFETFRHINSNFLYTKIGEINNFNYLQNLYFRIRQFIVLLSGELEFGFMYFQYPKNYLYPLLFILCLIWLISTVIYGRFVKSNTFNNEKVLFFIILIMSMIIFSPFTVSVFRLSHLMILYPLPQILMAVAILSFLRYFKNKIARWLVITFCSLAVIWDLVLFTNMMGSLNKTGGKELYSDSMYNLADFLKSQNAPDIYTFNPRLAVSLSFLAGREIKLRKPTHAIIDLESRKKIIFTELAPVNLTKTNLFVSHATIDYPLIQDFYSFAEKNGQEIIKKKQFYGRLGEPTFVVYSVSTKNIFKP